MCCSLIVDQGFSAYGAREIAKEPSKTPELVAEIVTARFLLAVIGYSSVVGFAYFFVHEPLIVNLLLLYGLSLWGLPFLLQWVFQGNERMNLVAITQIIRQSVFVAVIFVFVRDSDGLLFVGLAEVAAVLLAAAFSLWMYNRFIADVKRLRPAISGKLFREGMPIGVSQMFWVLRMFGATLVLGLVATIEDTGYFAAAMRIYIALHTFVWLYYFNLLPSLSRTWAKDPAKFAGLINHSLKTVTLVGLFAGSIWIVVAPFVMTTAYGPSFVAGGGALQWLAGACVAAGISGHFRFALIAAGLQGREMCATGIGSLIALVSIPGGYFYAGTSGAAGALVLAEVVVLVISWLFYRLIFSEDVPSSSSTIDESVFRRVTS